MTMTQAAPPERAPAGQRAPDRELRPERRSARLGWLAAGQVVVVELVAVAVAAALGRPAWILATVGVLALVILVASFARRGGRWWYAHLLLQRRFSRRVRAAGRTRPGDQGGAVLAVLAPQLRIAEIADRGSRIGVGADSDGWFVAFAVTAAAPSGQEPLITMDRLAAVLTASAVPVSTLQLVLHSVPAPSGGLDARIPCVNSYLELLDGAQVAADQQLWVAARLTPRDAAAAAAPRGGGLDGVHRALAALAGRVAKSLRTQGVQVQVLNAAELTAAIAAVGGLDGPPPGAATGAEPREQWQRWQVGDIAHVVFTVDDPAGPAPAVVLAAVTGAPLLSGTVSVLLAPRPAGKLSVATLLRVSAPAASIDEVTGRVERAIGDLGAQPHRLDGQQATGVYAAAPTGGGAW